MWSGTSALKTIDQSLSTVRNEAVRLDKQLSSLTANLAANQRKKMAIIQQISAIRLSEIEQGELRESLTYADSKAFEVLGLRKKALEQIESKITRLNQSVIDLESQRESLLGNVNDLSEQLVSTQTRVQYELKKDASYLQVFEHASQAEAVSQEAERKVTQAQQDMSAKAKPYQGDALFMYLWERGFGTTKYASNRLVRTVDSWVARLINYEESRVNFWNLTEIPKRLTEHAEQVADAADDAYDALQKIELDASQAAGVPKLESDIDQSRNVLDQCDDDIEQAEIALRDALSKRASFTAGEDTYMRKSLDVLSSALEHDNLQSIRRYVEATHSPTDDALVLQLHVIEDQVDDIEDDLADIRRLHDKQLSRLTELESIRRNFKNARYDDVRSGFSNQELLVSVLGKFVQGLINGSDVWNAIKRNQRYRNVGASPNFGTGALGGIGNILIEGAINGAINGAIDYTKRRQRRGRRSTWNLPRSRRSNDSAYRKPRTKRNGGFSTGGGF